MNIIIDASWIGGQYGKNSINGGYRIMDNFLRQLHRFPRDFFHLTHTTYSQEYTENLERYRKIELETENLTISAYSPFFMNRWPGTVILRKVNALFPVNAVIPFINKKVLNEASIYYSGLDSIPYVIGKQKKMCRFFTALDLIPIVQPQLSTSFYKHIKNLMDKLDSNTHIFAISENTKRDLLSYRPDIEPDRITITPLAADKKIFYSIPDPNSINAVLSKYKVQKNQYFLTVNGLMKYKNTRFLVENFLEWTKREPFNHYKLVLLGKKIDASVFDELNVFLGVKDKIIFLENIPDSDLAALYCGSLAFVYLSLYEGFGLPVLEAMQCGAPVIASDCSSIPEVAGRAALLISPTNGNDLIDSLTNVALRPALRDDLRQAGLNRATKFSWEKYADQIVEKFHEGIA